MKFVLPTTRSLNSEESFFESDSAKRQLFFDLLSWSVYRRCKTSRTVVIRHLDSLAHDGLQDADGVGASSAPGRGGGGIAAAGVYRSGASEPVVADFCDGGAYCGV